MKVLRGILNLNQHQRNSAFEKLLKLHDLLTRIKLFTAYDLATQCESRRASTRRHTIVGCSYQNINDSHSVPPSRPDSRQSTDCPSINAQPAQAVQLPHQPAAAPSVAQSAQTNPTNPNLPSTETWSKSSSTAESLWKDQLSANERLSLTLEEIVHIRSVMTKAELDCLPVGIHIKEDVEKRKLCFLCLRTKFGILGPRGVPCKLCQRTVCAKCYSKMRIPTEHFSNVPVLLLSPSLQNSPLSSNAPSPSHHAHGPMDETFPRSLMERLLWPESDRKVICKTFLVKQFLTNIFKTFRHVTLSEVPHHHPKIRDQLQAHPVLVSIAR